MNGHTGGWIDGTMDRDTKGQMGGWGVDGQMNGWMDR